ncbi:hypothetical protein RB601_003447 [Gaeumannomyces tritici]
MAVLGEQPDFALIERSFKEIGRQLGLFANLPAAIGVDAVMQRLDEIEHSFRTRFDNIETQMEASNWNTLARGMNKILCRGQHLHPLRGLATNDSIPQFPQKLQDIDKMTEVEFDAVLRALWHPTTGTVAEKRKRLVAATGFVLERRE